jgi:hypothetical protein
MRKQPGKRERKVRAEAADGPRADFVTIPGPAEAAAPGGALALTRPSGTVSQRERGCCSAADQSPSAARPANRAFDPRAVQVFPPGEQPAQ